MRIFEAFKSKRVWTILALVLINGFASVQGMLPAQVVQPLTWALGLLGVYFGIPKK